MKNQIVNQVRMNRKPALSVNFLNSIKKEEAL